ncbi:MAG: hypothetical protein KGD65_16060 [Candidatus Lokiarchaeota archaeon]|nr:hypothetical protein [Candidatus Lokiarchaeota archaeon]
MTLVVCDSSFLILISKLEMLDLLIENFEHVMIPQAVYSESVDQGIKLRKMDAYLVEKRVKDGNITVGSIKDLEEKENLMKNFNMHEGESESLILYSEKKADLFGSDDYKTIKVCKILKIRYFTTPLFIFRCFSNKLLSKDQSLLKFEKLQEFGWYKEDLIIEFKNRLENI